MSHYAHISGGIVDQVIVAEASYIASLSESSSWVQTSYNTIGGVHVDPLTRKPDGGIALHKNYAGIGYSWDGIGFAAPQPFPSWTLDPKSYRWKAPVDHPLDGKMYSWDESAQAWKEFAYKSP
jgi:hypothetical protein